MPAKWFDAEPEGIHCGESALRQMLKDIQTTFLQELTYRISTGEITSLEDYENFLKEYEEEQVDTGNHVTEEDSDEAVLDVGLLLSHKHYLVYKLTLRLPSNNYNYSYYDTTPVASISVHMDDELKEIRRKGFQYSFTYLSINGSTSQLEEFVAGIEKLLVDEVTLKPYFHFFFDEFFVTADFPIIRVFNKEKYEEDLSDSILDGNDKIVIAAYALPSTKLVFGEYRITHKTPIYMRPEVGPASNYPQGQICIAERVKTKKELRKIKKLQQNADRKKQENRIRREIAKRRKVVGVDDIPALCNSPSLTHFVGWLLITLEMSEDNVKDLLKNSCIVAGYGLGHHIRRYLEHPDVVIASLSEVIKDEKVVKKAGRAVRRLSRILKKLGKKV